MNPTKQAQLKALLAQLDNLGKPSVKNESFQIVSPDFFTNLDSQLSKFTDNLAPIKESIASLAKSLDESEQQLRDELQEKINSIPKTPDLSKEVSTLQSAFEKKLKALQNENKDILKTVDQKLSDFIISNNKETTLDRLELDKQFREIRAEVISRTQRGGGSMNRQIKVEGVDVLTKYTDINIYGASSSVLTSVDNVNKRVNIEIPGSLGGPSFGTISVSGQSSVVAGMPDDVLTLVAGSNITLTTNAGNNSVTITSSGGGGSVTGISRTTSIITANTTGGNTTGVDYVYLANAGLQFTLPTAIGNNNLYTVKNTAVSSVLIGVTAGQSIDGSSTVLLTQQ